MRAKTTILLFFLLTLCLVLTPIAMAQALTVTTDMDVYAPGETIQVSGTAIANTDVTVQLLNPNNQLVDIDYVKSGADGSYSLSFVIPAEMPTGQWIFGTYVVKAFMGSQVATKTITIQQKIAVTGKVVDSTGAGISGATVTVGTATATTAADGTFTVYLSSEGTYTVKVTKTGYYSYTGNVTAAIGTNDLGTITLTSYEDKIKELEDKIDDLTSTVNSLNKQVSDLSGLSSKVDDLSSKVDDLSSTVDDLRSQLNSLSSSLQSANNEISSLKSTIQQIQTTVDVVTGLKSSVDALQETVNSLKSSVDTLQATTSQLPILYALALIGIIIAVIAVVIVYRKIAT